MRTAAFQATGAGGSAPVEPAAAAADPGLSGFVGEELSKVRPPGADLGQDHHFRRPGMQKRREFHQCIEPVADKLGAAVGASRAAVDAGYAPND